MKLINVNQSSNKFLYFILFYFLLFFYVNFYLNLFFNKFKYFFHKNI